MITEKTINCERNQIEKLINFQLPRSFKAIGIFFALSSSIGFILYKAFLADFTWIEQITKTVFIVGLLMIALSKDAIEDELIKSIRMKSFALGLIIGTLYMIVFPYIIYGADQLLNEVHKPFKEMTAYNVIGVILMYQVLFFEFLKRTW